MRNFCVKCGCECEESLDGLCIDCWLAGRKLVDLPHHVDLSVCTNCREYDFGGRWVRREPEVAIQDAAADALMLVRGAELESVSTGMEEQDPRTFVVTVHAGCSVMGYPAEGEASTIVRIKNTVCRRCSRQLGSYYEAILQIRTASGKLDDATREEALAMTENSVARQAATNRQLFITKMEIVTGGVDVYLSSIALGKSLAKELAEAFCAETKESPKLVGQTTDGQDMYRLTYLVRLPDYRAGDVVVFQGRYCKLSRVNGNGGRLVDLVDFRDRSVRRADMTQIRLYEKASDLAEATVVSRSGTEVQVLDPSNYSTVDLRVPADAEIGDTVKVTRIEDVLYLVP
ncbi:MAG: NMD3-related protein [Thermoplasmata archaeon]|nr:NMD3-related protein [Thermoplasmata archaeon]